MIEQQEQQQREVTEPDPYFYNVTAFWPSSELSDALIYALRNGMTGADLPEPPSDRGYLDALLPYWHAVHKVLDERGMLAAFRRDSLMNARATQCPWWCRGQHPKLISGVGDISHDETLAEVTFADKDSSKLHGPSELQLVLCAYDDGHSVVEADLAIDGDLPHRMDVEDVQRLADAFAEAAVQMRRIAEIDGQS